jgi:lipopolysaccharide/colanic/teichoic acid biosynthesis glycosyltransferase
MSSKIQLILKRFIDILLSLIGLVLLTVPFAIIAVAIKLDSKGSVFFRQERVGKDGRSLRVWKFRTMVVGAVQQGLGYNVAKDDSRITSVGSVLRNWGLDELPQLINVFVGNMSLVGPRPTLRYQVEHYDDFQRRRLQVKPGITSLAVVSGRNALSWKERIELDVWYVEHWSLWLDIKILFKTLWTVLVTHEGLYGEDGVNDPFVAPPKKEANRDA